MRNNWLSFTLPQKTRDALHELANSISRIAKFRIMDYNSFHMTAVFLGEQFTRKDYDTLFQLIDESRLRKDPGLLFEFEGLEFFPPTKRNLVVAKFGISKVFGDVIQVLKQDIRDKMGYRIPEEGFIAHVTLGKLAISTHELLDLIKSDALKGLSNKFHTNELNFSVDRNEPLYMSGKY